MVYERGTLPAAGISRISTCRFNQGVPGLDPARQLGLLDHSQGNSVFDAATSAKAFELGIDCCFYTKALGDLVQPDKRCVPNLLKDGLHGSRRWSGSCAI